MKHSINNVGWGFFFQARSTYWDTLREEDEYVDSDEEGEDKDKKETKSLVGGLVKTGAEALKVLFGRKLVILI